MKVDRVILTGEIIAYIIIKNINNSNNNNDKTPFTLFDSKLKQLCSTKLHDQIRGYKRITLL